MKESVDRAFIEGVYAETLFSRTFIIWNFVSRMLPFEELPPLLWKLRLRIIQNSGYITKSCIEAVRSRSSNTLTFMFCFRPLHWLNLLEVTCDVLVSWSAPTTRPKLSQIYLNNLLGVYCSLVCRFNVSSLLSWPWQNPLALVQRLYR